jgi:hypothetical protein
MSTPIGPDKPQPTDISKKQDPAVPSTPPEQTSQGNASRASIDESVEELQHPLASGTKAGKLAEAFAKGTEEVTAQPVAVQASKVTSSNIQSPQLPTTIGSDTLQTDAVASAKTLDADKRLSHSILGDMARNVTSTVKMAGYMAKDMGVQYVKDLTLEKPFNNIMVRFFAATFGLVLGEVCLAASVVIKLVFWGTTMALSAVGGGLGALGALAFGQDPKEVFRMGSNAVAYLTSPLLVLSLVAQAYPLFLSTSGSMCLGLASFTEGKEGTKEGEKFLSVAIAVAFQIASWDLEGVMAHTREVDNEKDLKEGSRLFAKMGYDFEVRKWGGESPLDREVNIKLESGGEDIRLLRDVLNQYVPKISDVSIIELEDLGRRGDSR